MRPATLWQYVLVVAIGLAGTGWLTTARAQDRTPSNQPVLSTLDGRIQIFSDQLPSLTTPAGRGGAPTLSVDGFTSHLGYGSGDPLNTTLHLPIGAGNQLIGIGWEVHLTAHDPNWLADAVVAIVPNVGSDAGYFLSPASGVNTAGSGNFSSGGILMFEDAGIAPVPAGANGTLYMEFYTAFTSPDTQPIEWMDSTAPEVLPPGLRLICTDQAACDAAVADSGGGDLPAFKLTASDGAADDWFGRDVAIDGTTALVGADAADVGGTNNRGAAYVFERVGDAWVQQAILTASDGASSHQFGISVALSGDVAVVGTGNGEAAYVFRRSGDSWAEEAKLTASDGVPGDYFGIAVALDGDTAVIGAREADVAGRMNQGAAYVFVRQGSQWVQEAKLTASNGQAFDLFGDAVAVSGGTAVVGAAFADPSGHDSRGAAYVFVRQGGSWAEQAMLTAADGAAGHRFGSVVAVSGDLAVVGAPLAEAAYAFARTGASWSQQARFAAPDAAAGAWFGDAVAVHGETVLVGALFADETRGAAYLFRREQGTWDEGQRLAPDDAAGGDQFGNAVALTGQQALIGAWQATVEGAAGQGAAYVFPLDGEGGGEDPPPGEDALVFDPEVLVEELMAGEVGTETVTITNTSDEPLEFTFIQYADGDARTAPVLHRALDLPKGVRDPRPASAPGRGQGGPDAFGYAWIDSNEPNGPEYDWIDIAATGTVVPLHDDGEQTVNLPFPFEFYGQEYTSIRIIANGWLGFDGTAIAYLNQPIPTPDEPNNFIAPFWDDLNPSEGGTILYQDMGDGRFVVSWIGVPHYPADGAATFQAILYQHGAIKFQYQSIDFPVEGLASATIGIENADGTDGVQVVYNAPYVEEELAVLIQARPTFVTDVSPVSGVIPAGGSVSVDVTFDATSLIGGTYEGRLTVEAGGGTYDLPVVLEVTGEACLALDPAALDFGAVLVNASVTLETTATNCGTDVTTISAVSVDHGDYTVEVEGGLPIALAPGASTVIAVTFTPTSESTIEGTLSVSSDAPGSPHTVALTGIGAPPPDLSVAPTELVFNVDAGTLSEPQTITLTNSGEGDGTFAIVTTLGRPVRAPVAGSAARGTMSAPSPMMTRDRLAAEPAAPTLRERMAQAVAATQQRAFAARSDEASAGPAPVVARSPLTLPLNLRGGESSIAYGHDAANGNFGSFDFLTPGVFNPINSVPANDFIGAGTLGRDPEVAYQVDGSVLYRVSTATGEATEVGDLGVALSGMTYDPTTRTFYGVPFVPAPEPTPLYVVDVETATLTLVGSGSYSTGIALAATPTGTLYTYDINTDVFLQVDKTTGEGTVIGPIGFDANFGQGMTYDYVNDVMYMAAYNAETFQPELRAVDLETGATTLVGVLGVGQMGWAGAPAMGPRFLVVTPQEGTVPASGQAEIQVQIDATELNGGTYEADIVVVTNDPLNPEFVVDVTINVTGAPGILIEPGALAFGEVIAGDEATQALTITNTGTDVLSVSGISTDDEAFTVDGTGSFELGVGQSETILVTFGPDAPGAYTGTLTVASNATSSPDAVTLMGTGVAAPVAGVDQDEVSIHVEPDATGAATLTLSNHGGDDAADLVFSVAVAEARPMPTRSHGAAQARASQPRRSLGAALSAAPSAARGGDHGLRRADGSTWSGSWIEALGAPRAFWRGGEEVTITHSLSQAIEELAGVACGSFLGTAENSFWRVFDLSSFDLGGAFDVTSVDVGVETATVTTPTTVRLYTLDGAFVTSNLTLVGEATYTLNPTDFSVVTIPVEGSFEGDDVLVVEWAVPNLQDVTGFVYPGANAAGQTGPTYLSSETCGLVEPTDAVEIDFPDFHWVLNVNGTAGSALLTVSPESGAIAPGESQELTLTVDASQVEPGEYAFDVMIATNDPARPTVTVPVSVTVGETTATEEGAVPAVFALEQNYPNPFAAQTVIEYALPEASHVRLQVYDAVGRLVATLVEGEHPAGYHEVVWSANGLASGVYFYRIEAGSYRSTQKMVLVQ